MSPHCGFRNDKEVTDTPPRKVPKMDSFISGIIDYVARPSTTDSPVRVVHKKSESEAPCESIDNDGGMESFEVTEISNLIDNDTESTSETDTWGQPSSLLSQFNVVQFNVPDVMRNNSVLTAEGIITCGDLACFNTMMDGDGDNNNRVITAIPEEPTPSIETPVVKQFESAFAHFLYKNPAFSSMSYMTLQKLRSKLLKESAKNMKVEDELRKQLSALRESKQSREGELQRELLIVTKAKAAREAELQSYIDKTKHECAVIENMMLTDVTNNNNKGSNTSSQHVTPLTRGRTDSSITNASPRSVFHAEFLPHTHPPGHTYSPGHSHSPGHHHSPGNNTPWMIASSLSFDEFKREMYKNKMEQAHIRAEMELLKQKIAEQSVNAALDNPMSL